MTTKFWENIEEPIRDAVRLLRNNGFNTTGSCGHEMWIEVDLANNLGVAESIASCLVENGYIGFRIECTMFIPPDGLWVRRAIIYFKDWLMSRNA